MKTFILRSMCFTAALLCAVLQINAQSVEDFISVEDGLNISIQNDVDYPWIVNEDGVLVSNMHEDGGSASITFKNNSDENVYCVFEWRVSSEQNFDYLRVYGLLESREISGDQTEYQQIILLIAPDDYVTFEYYKDGSNSSYEDCGYVSNLKFSKLYDTDKEWEICPNYDWDEFDHTATIVKYQNPYYSEISGEPISLSIPSKIIRDGIVYKITAIGGRVFEDYPYINDIYNVDIPETVVSIENYAFSRCSGLISISLPNSVEKIGSNAFWGCYSLNSVSLSSSLKEIGDYAFYNCQSLKSITIPASVELILYHIFEGCIALESISVESDNLYYDSRNNCNAIIKTETNTLKLGCKNTIIPNDVTKIGDEAFYDCFTLTSIEIPNSVTSIGMEAFAGCTSLTSIQIPSSVTSIGLRAFCECSSLLSVEIPNSVTSISPDAFEYCYSLTSVEIPNSVTSIGSCAFAFCHSLTSVKIPSSVTSIGSLAFCGCTGLTSIEIPSSVTLIEEYTFGGCSNLKHISFEGCVQELSNDVFYGIGDHTTVTVNSTQVGTINRDSWASNPKDLSNCILYVPAEAVETYKSAELWKEFGTILSIPKEAEYSLYTKEFAGRPGSQVKLALMMNNENPITSWQSEMVLPEGFTLAESEDEEAITLADERTYDTDVTLAYNTIEDGVVKMVAGSMTKSTFSDSFGKVATITLNVSPDVKEGDYYVEFCNSKFVDPDRNAYTYEKSVCKVKIIDFKMGDANNDGDVDVEDLVVLVDFIMDRPVSGCINAAADINKDGEINGVDYVAEINLILGVTPTNGAKAKARFAAEAMDNACISTTATFMQAGSFQNMNVSLRGTNGKSTLMQFDIVLPEGISIAEGGACILGANSVKHNLAVEQIRKNMYRVMMYSASKSMIREEQNGVLALSLVADDTMEVGEYNVTLDNQVIVDANGEYTKPTSTVAKIFITDATAIDTITAPESEKSDIYNLNGTIIRKSGTSPDLSKGVYISGGKKVVVK